MRRDANVTGVSTAVGTAGSISSGRRRPEGDEMAHELPPLPYDYDALAPTIDEQTMRIHHGKHHQAYVDNLNKALEGTPWADTPLDQLIGALEDIVPEDKRTAVRNNGGGHANHSLFWTTMKPGGGGGPSGSLASAIDDVFGGVDALKQAV